MSDDLVERVARAIRQAHFASHPQNNFGYPHAAAALAAVAEWLIDEFSYQAEMIEVKEAISAALRAATEAKE